MYVKVVDSKLDKAIRVLKKKMDKEGVTSDLKKKRHFEKPSARRRRKQAAAMRRKRREQDKSSNY
ncbi:30S ribosomal protein S21 [bacterium]|nr:30S ribosomal protein S21 [candidate division CSSED10-310 bacterium]